MSGENMKKVHSFTLIELLVVIAIIGILMTLLMPSLSRAREKSRRAVCRSNHHQFYLAVMSYADDNSGYFLDERKGGKVHKIPTGDRKKFEPYLSSWQVTYCPSYPKIYDPEVILDTSILLLGGLDAASNIGSQTDWESPMSITADSNLEFLADRNEIPNVTWPTKFCHTPNGGFMSDSPVQPESVNVEGTINTKLNGSTRWVTFGEMNSHAASPGAPAVQWWW